MKVRIEFTVDIDVEGWATDYGLDRVDVREDVRRWAALHVIEELRGRGLLNEKG